MSNENKGNVPDYQTAYLDGLQVDVYRGADGSLVVDVQGPKDEDLNEKQEPDIRIWLNEALIYAHGETGDDLSESGKVTVGRVKELAKERS